MEGYTLIKNDDGTIYFLLESEIHRNEPLHNMFNRGIRYTPSDVEDYSLYNLDSCAADEMRKEGAKIFGETFMDLEYESNYCNDFLSELDCDFGLNLDEIGLYDRADEVRAFIKEWEANNAEYKMGDYYTYWDGHNHNSILLSETEGTTYLEYEELGEHEAAPIMKALEGVKRWEESSAGISIAYYGGYKFTDSSWEGHLGVYEAESLDTEERLMLAQSEFDLEEISTTSETSGYPKNVEQSLIGFNDFLDAESCANRYGLTIDEFMKKDGWQLWCRANCRPNEELKVTSEDYGDDYEIFDADGAADFFEYKVKPFLEDMEDLDDLEDITANAREVIDEIENLGDDEGVVVEKFRFREVVKLSTMRKVVDNRTYAIGVKASKY